MPATLPLRSGWASATKRWTWAAAAVFLIAFGLPFAGYQLGSVQRSRDLQQAENDALAKREQRERLRDQFVADQSAATDQLMAKHVRLQVHGPAEIQPNQANLFRVSTTDLKGLPVGTQVTARVARDKDGPPLFEKKLRSEGDLLVSLPPLELAQGSKASVEFSADSSEGLELVREVLEVHPASEATHLVLEKSLYQAGDRILFRSVTLERATWRPDAKPFAIQYDLTGPDGRLAASLRWRAHARRRHRRRRIQTARQRKTGRLQVDGRRCRRPLCPGNADATGRRMARRPPLISITSTSFLKAAA